MGWLAISISQVHIDLDFLHVRSSSRWERRDKYLMQPLTMLKVTKQRPNGSRWWPTKHNLLSKRWRLRHSPAGHNDYHRVELPGLGNRRAVEVLAELVRSKAPTILFLMETKRTVQAMEPIKVELGFQSMLAVSSEGRRGGLALLWKSGVVIDTNTYSPHHIDAQVLPPSGQPWRLTGIYGYPDE